MTITKIPIGEVIEDNKYGPFVIEEDVGIKKINGYDKHLVVIKFLNSNMFNQYTKRIIPYKQIAYKNVTDYYQPTYYNVACIGNTLDTPYNYRHYQLWIKMIRRCYDINNDSYRNYGLLGVTVCSRWRCYEYFNQDIINIPGYELWISSNSGEYHLDKDTLQSNISINKKVYAPGTCIFTLARQNIVEALVRNNKNNYLGVVPRSECSTSFRPHVNNRYLGTYNSEIAAANVYNNYAKVLGLYINDNVPYMGKFECLQHKKKPIKKNGKYKMISHVDPNAPDYVPYW